MATVQIKPDYENGAELWWDVARGRDDIPPELAPLLDGMAESVSVSAERAVELFAWCERIPGWADGPEYAQFALYAI